MGNLIDAIIAGGVGLAILQLNKPEWQTDPDITRDKNHYVSHGGLGHRVWLPADKISGKTVELTLENTGDNLVTIEQNCSYGFVYVVQPGETVTTISTPANTIDCPRRIISDTEQPGQPYARVKNSDLNIWLFNSSVKIKQLKIKR